MDFPNLDLLESAAEKLRPLLPEIVFVGERVLRSAVGSMANWCWT